MQERSNTAIVLAAGQGKRMGTKVQKQYLEILNKPVLFYSLHVFQNSDIIDEIILVVGKDQEEYCKREIVEKYGFTKVTQIVEGGHERYASVANGLEAMTTEDGIVFIHDGARPFIDDEILERAYSETLEHHACVVGMPVKDTIKIADEHGFSNQTPNRNLVWMIQTPQVFEKSRIKKAYRMLMNREDIQVTDDASVLEVVLGEKVRLVQGSYENIKITTPEDIEIAQIFASKRN